MYIPIGSHTKFSHIIPSYEYILSLCSSRKAKTKTKLASFLFWPLLFNPAAKKEKGMFVYLTNLFKLSWKERKQRRQNEFGFWFLLDFGFFLSVISNTSLYKGSFGFGLCVQYESKGGWNYLDNNFDKEIRENLVVYVTGFGVCSW